MSEATLRIGILTWRDLGHPDGGGSEVYVEEVARRLAARGHEVELHCAMYPGARRDEWVDGVHLRRRGGRLGVYPRAWWWTRRRRHDVVLDVVNGIPFLAPLATRRTVALVHHVHREQWRMIYPDVRGRVGWWIESRLFPWAYRRCPVLTVSEHTAADLELIGIDRGRVALAHNGLVPRPRVRAERDPQRLCVLARLVPHKQIEHAIEVVASLAPTHPELRLDVVGEGWWHDRLVETAESAGVADRVRFHGWLADDERDAVLASATAMVMPSAKEGWCLAVMEAAAQGTPTVAYAWAGGIAESVVDGRTGVLVQDRTGLADAVAGLLADPGRANALGEAARHRAAGFSWDVTADVVEAALTRRAGQSP